MKVLLINDYATQTGGAELLTLALRKGLRARGHDARLFASSARPLGVPSLADYDCLGTLSRFRILLQTFNPWAWFKLRRALADFQPDVVHVTIALTQLSPLIFPLLKDIPAVYNAQWYRTICPKGTKVLPGGKDCQHPAGFACHRQRCLPLQDWILLTIQMSLVKRWIKVFDKIVAASEAVKNRLLAEGIEEPVEVIWNGTPGRDRCQTLSSLPTIVFAGRLVREKGVDVLLHALAAIKDRLPDVKLLVAGEGIERSSLERLAVELEVGDRVSFLGHLERSDLEALFEQAWVQVIPSRWAEPFGLVAAEASMRGTAIIASEVGGLAEIVFPGQTGFLVPPNNPDALAEKLLDVLSNYGLAQKLGKQGKDIAIRKLSETAFVENFLAVYQSLLVRKAPDESFELALDARHI